MWYKYFHSLFILVECDGDENVWHDICEVESDGSEGEEDGDLAVGVEDGLLVGVYFQGLKGIKGIMHPSQLMYIGIRFVLTTLPCWFKRVEHVI